MRSKAIYIEEDQCTAYNTVCGLRTFITLAFEYESTMSLGIQIIHALVAEYALSITSTRNVIIRTSVTMDRKPYCTTSSCLPTSGLCHKLSTYNFGNKDKLITAFAGVFYFVCRFNK